MSLRLEAILFNHDSSSATVDAFNIRKNEHVPIEPPEWRRGVTNKPKDSPAAYARCETQGNTLTIKANFSFDGTGEHEIRARDANLHREPLNGPNLSQQEVALFENMEVKPEGNVLGEVNARTLTLNPGETGFQPFDLGSVRIWDAGVGVDDIVWRWQFRVSGTANWIDFAITTHRIYTVLRVPNRPWSQVQNVFDTQLPWTEVLDRACEWAKAARNPDDAAEKIARQVNGLGQIFYDNCNYGSSHYSDRNNFDCTAFLSRIRCETGHGPRVNCSDCAAVVSTFANSIGCDLEQSVMKARGLPVFPLQEHLRIGLPGSMTGAFVYHEVAWEGMAGEPDEVFDACVQVDGDDDPGTFSPFVPTNLLFGAIGQRGYRFRLVPRGYEATCRARPELKRRRKLGPVSSPRALPAALDHFKFVYAYDSWKETKGPGTQHFILDYFFGDFALPGWQVIGQRHSGSRGKRPFIQSFWKPTQGPDEVVLRIDVCESSIWTDAREVLLTYLAELQLPGLKLREQHFELGDVALTGPEPGAMLFANANIALLVRNVGKDVLPVTDIAAAMTENLLRPPRISPASSSSFEIAKRFRFESAETSFGESMRIIEDPPGPVPGRFYQFFSQKGEVSLRGEELFYRPLEPGQHTLDIFAINSQGAVPAQRLPLTVRNTELISTRLTKENRDMAHIFDGSWGSTLINPLSGSGDDGRFELEVDPATNRLKPSSTHLGQPITGDVTNFTITMHQTLNLPGIPAIDLTYEGNLCGEVLVGIQRHVLICGVVTIRTSPFPTDAANLDAARDNPVVRRLMASPNFAQEQEIWIANKP